MENKFNYFLVEKQDGIATVWLNSPENRNLMRWQFWQELPEIMAELSEDQNTHVVIIAAKGKSFSLGLDIPDIAKKFPYLREANTTADRARLYKLIVQLQDSISSVANCSKPVIAAVQKHCFGGGLDLISACDLRLCTKDAQFSLFEVRVAIVADVGSLQRLPKIIGEGNLKEMAFTGRFIKAQRAYDMGLINQIYPSNDELIVAARKWAKEIASHSNFVVKGIKHVLDSSRDLSLDASLKNVATYNSAFLQSEDFYEVMKKAVDSDK